MPEADPFYSKARAVEIGTKKLRKENRRLGREATELSMEFKPPLGPGLTKQQARKVQGGALSGTVGGYQRPMQEKLREFKETGKIGDERPKNLKDAVRIAGEK